MESKKKDCDYKDFQCPVYKTSYGELNLKLVKEYAVTSDFKTPPYTNGITGDEKGQRERNSDVVMNDVRLPGT